MGTHSELYHNGSVIRFDGDAFHTMEPRLFDVDWLKAEGHHRGSSRGRGEAHFLTLGGHDLVLRPFRRGGLIGRFNRDLYLRGGIEQSRSMQEFALLQWMRGMELPVPRAMAAQVTPVGPFYRAALLTERIPDARPMEDALRHAPLPAEVWRRVGTTIAQLHNAGVDHTDLNCRNIIIDAQDKAWLIDFDKCQRRTAGEWRNDNLDRLERSLRKEQAKAAGLHWTQGDWAELLAGYESAKSDGADDKR